MKTARPPTANAILNWLVVDLLRVAHNMRAHCSRCYRSDCVTPITQPGACLGDLDRWALRGPHAGVDLVPVTRRFGLAGRVDRGPSGRRARASYRLLRLLAASPSSKGAARRRVDALVPVVPADPI